MKFQKPTRFDILLVLWIIVPIILFFISNSLLYHTMTGAEGLKNIILSIILKTVTGIALAVPMFITEINIFRITDLKKSKIVSFGLIFLTAVVPLTVFILVTNSRLDEQHYIRKQQNVFADYITLFQCISDLSNDDYEEFTINNVYIKKHRHSSPSGRGGSSYRYEYTATFYNGKSKVAEMQISPEDTEDLNNLPYGFDTTVTVYKKSGFLRSVRPSVDFGKDESYEHFFTISIDDDKIIYEKNIDIDIKNLTWSGFKKNQNYDIHNSLFGINADGEKKSLDADYIGTLCSEVCLYGTVDGQYRRLSNVLTE